MLKPSGKHQNISERIEPLPNMTISERIEVILKSSGHQCTIPLKCKAFRFISFCVYHILVLPSMILPKFGPSGPERAICCAYFSVMKYKSHRHNNKQVYHLCGYTEMQTQRNFSSFLHHLFPFQHTCLNRLRSSSS